MNDKQVKSEQLGVTFQGIRENRSKNLLVDLKRSAENRQRQNPAFSEVVGASGSVHHLISRIELEVTDINPNIQIQDVEEAIRGPPGGRMSFWRKLGRCRLSRRHKLKSDASHTDSDKTRRQYVIIPG